MNPITRLPTGVSDLIQAAISLPTFPSILAELIHNAIDATATQIDCWINPVTSSLRVTDNGCGIDKEELKRGLGCERGMTSKREAGADGDCALGFRGQGKYLWSVVSYCMSKYQYLALASMGKIALLEIISRCPGFATTYYKAIKVSLSSFTTPKRRNHNVYSYLQNGKTLSCGPSQRHSRANPGTTVILRNLYYTVSW